MQHCVTLAAKGILVQHLRKDHTETLKAWIVEQNVNLRNLPAMALSCLQFNGKLKRVKYLYYTNQKSEKKSPKGSLTKRWF